MSLPDGVTTCLLTYGPITDTFGNLADSITVEVVADRTIVHAASGRTMFKHPVSVTAEGGGVAQLPVPHTDQAGFRDQQQNSLTGWYYTVTLTARFPGGGIESDRKTFQPLVGQVTRDADLLSSPGMVTPGVTVDGTAVTSVNGQTGEVDLTATFVPRWKASTAVLAGALAIAPTGHTIQRVANGTTGATYDSTEAGLWTVVSGGGGGGGGTSDVVPWIGESLSIWTHSWGADTGSNSGYGFHKRLRDQYKFNPSILRSLVMGGRWMQDIFWPAVATSGLPLGYVGIDVIDAVVNDVNSYLDYDAGNKAKALDGFTQTVFAFIETLRGQERQISTQIGTYTGTWTQPTATNLAYGNTYHQSVVQNDYVQFTVGFSTGHTSLDVLLLGVDDVYAAAQSAPGGATSVEVLVDGVVTQTVSLSNRCKVSANGNTWTVPIIVKLTGLATGVRTIRVRKADAGAGALRFNGIILPADTGVAPYVTDYDAVAVTPIALVSDGPNAANAPSAEYDGYQVYLAALQGVAARYTDQDVRVVDLMAAGWDVNEHILHSAVGGHPNDAGHQFVADAIAAEMAPIDKRRGLTTG